MNQTSLKPLRTSQATSMMRKQKGEPLSECLASILNASLRCHPLSEGVKVICDKIQILSNVPNLKVPTTNHQGLEFKREVN